MFGKHDAGWVRVFHCVIVLSMLLTLCSPTLQRSRVLAASSETVSATASADAPLRPSLTFQTTLPQWLTAQSAQDEVPNTPPDAPVVDPPEPQPELPHRPPVWIEVEASPAAAIQGDTVTLTVRIQSEADLPDAVLTSILPSGLDFLSAEGDRAFYNPTDRTLQWPLGQLLASDAPEFQFRVRIDATAPDLMVQNVELRVPGFSGPATGQVVLKRLFPAAETRITPDAGGTLHSADGRVQVVFPPGAVSQSVRVEHTPIQVDLLPAQRGGLALQFDLNAYTDDEAAASIHQFDSPLELRVDMTGLVSWDDLAPWQYPFLGYLDDKTGEWIPLPARREGNILVAQLDHFTTIGGGTGNNYESGWLLALNDAHVSTFTGGLNYDFPIQVPGGRGGLTPDLRLNYNSRRVDGILTWTQTDWAGLGWTLDTMSIARRVTPDYTPTSGKPAWYWGPWVGWENKFTLMYKGTRYKLIPGSTSACGRYYTEDEQFLYIERRNAASGCSSDSANTTSEYWIVRLRDGTEYRLGYLTESEQIVATNYYTVPVSPSESNYAGDTDGRVAFQWRVDKIADVHGNVIEFSYAEETTGDPTVRDKASYLSQVRYNYLTSGWGTRITFTRAARSSDGVGDAVDPNYQYYYFYQNDFLQRIKVENWDSGQYNTVREYLLTYDARTVPPEEHNNHTRRLASIKEYGTDGYGGDFLPATTFGYTIYYNKDWCTSCQEWELWNRETFRYERLTSVNNGYGGAISLTYESPDGGWWHAWNYRVSQKTVSDGQSGGSKIAYAYTTSIDQRCYVDPMNSEAFGCYFFQPMSTTGGSLVGYGSVTETLKTIGDTAIAVTGHKSKLDTLASPDRSKGREQETRYQDATGTEQKRTETTWVVSTLSSPTRYFVYAQWVKEFTRQNGGMPADPQKKTYYDYATSQQGGAQYGNLTQILEYQGANAYRQTLHYFYPNTTTWIVDRPGLTWLKDGAGNSQAKTKFIYDNTGNPYTTPPVRGDLVKKEQTVSVSPSDSWITTQTITYKDSSYYYLPYIVADGNNNQTTTTYDTTWKMYPLTVTNALGQATTYEYNYVLGKVKKVTGPNGTTTATSYEFDEFGRLTKVIRPGDDSTYPTIKYEYCDTCTPLRIITTQRLTVGAGGLDIPTLRFYNGIGQLIQQNTGTTDDTQMTIANTVYNAQGLVEKSYVPYFATYSTAYQTPDTNQPKTTYAYDALGRATTVTNPDSTTVRTYYDGLKKAVLDENNHQKIYENDAFGRLGTVKEYTGTYTGNPNWTIDPYATTTYAYNTLDLLTTVTDAASNQTTMTYDALGRKTAMTDPDMGAWSYTYDNAGNLKTQTDARGTILWFGYDALNRLTEKRLTNSAGTLLAKHYYDEVGYGYSKGYRTRMQAYVGGVLNNTTSWNYDTRGRVSSETRTIDSTNYTTQWTYNSADQPTNMTYPDSEASSLTYTIWGSPNGLSSALGTYVQSTTYDAAGRVTQRILGSDVRRTEYVYFPWTTVNGAGRLQQLKSGTSGNMTSLQNLTYTYDATANVKTLTDGQNSAQRQCFTYDDLDRLTRGFTGNDACTAYDGSRGAGVYDEPYEYTSTNGKIGNLTRKGDGYYFYDSTRKHAVRSVIGTGGSSLSITVRAKGTAYLGVFPSMSLRVNGAVVKTWTVNTTSYSNYIHSTTLTGNDVLEVAYTNDESTRTLYVDYVIVNGVTVQAEGGAMVYDRGSGSAAYDGFDVLAGREMLDVNGALRFVKGAKARNAGYDANGNMTSRLEDGKAYLLTYDSENRLTTANNLAIGQTTTFTYDGDGNRVKVAVGSTTTVYIGNHYEKNTSTGVITKYYYTGGQRVAMRAGSALYYLFSDHLGSSSVSLRASDSNTLTQRYYPWGTIRPGPDNGLPTDYTFTGQKLDTSTGLLYYVARYYDPTLGRFTQPDTIVPDPGNPQSLNRYAYALNNPTKYTDPSGHAICEDETCQNLTHVPPKMGPAVPRAVWLAYLHMISEARGKTVATLKTLNTQCLSCNAPVGYKSEAARADMYARASAAATFVWNVRQGGDWDLKPKMEQTYGKVESTYWNQIEAGGPEYYYDLWGNIDFGYLGRASAFSEDDLLEGAGMEQIGSSFATAIRLGDPGRLPKRVPRMEGWRAYDHPPDQLAIQIGINLWNAYGLSVRPEDVIEAIKRTPGLVTR